MVLLTIIHSKKKLDVIAMTKKSLKIHYAYEGKMQSVKDIYNQNRKRPGRSKYLLSVTVEVIKDDEYVPARLVFVRNRSKKKDYLVLITTDMILSEEEVIHVYGKRWKFEVFFKTCKSWLKHGCECHSLSYDVLTAHVAIVFVRYMILAIHTRQNQDEQTIGELFLLMSDELTDIDFATALSFLPNVLYDFLSERFCLTSKQLDELVEVFMTMLPAVF